MIQKTINDYYDQIADLYPTIPRKDIEKIMLYGIKQLYLINSYGGDTLVRKKDFWFYCGRLMNDSLKFFYYYKRKMSIKLKVLYKRKHVEWDGYYYFALNNKQYQDYLAQKHKRGRPRKHFHFEKILLYKIYDECCIRESSKTVVFRVPWIIEKGDTMFIEKLDTDKAELILEREPLKLKDILLFNYDYQFIKDKNRTCKKRN